MLVVDVICKPIPSDLLAVAKGRVSVVRASISVGEVLCSNLTTF